MRASAASTWMSSQLETVLPCTDRMRSPSRMPACSSGEPGFTYPTMVWLRATGRPTHHTMEARTKARATFMAGPARATATLAAGGMGATAGSDDPSITSEVIIWGSLT